MAANFPLDIVLRAIDRVSAPLRGIAGRIQAFGGRLAAVGGRIAEFSETSGINRLAGSIVNLGGAAKGVGEGIGAMATRIAGLAAAAGLGTAGITAMGKAYADATGAIGDAAERTGITRERFQELSFAAMLSGSSAETLEGALTKMGLAVGKATSGSKDLKEMFSGLGIKLKNSNGTLKTTDELFNTFVDRISKIKDPSLQAEAAVKVFGKSATELLPLIRGGKAGLGEMADEARRLGVVLSEDAVREGEAFGDLLDTLATAFKGVGNTIGAALVPQLNKLGAMLIETIVKYRPQIEAFATAFAADLPGNIDTVVGFLQDLYTGIQPVISAMGVLADTFGGANVALAAVGLYVGGPLIVSLFGLVGALFSVSTAVGGVLLTALSGASGAFAAMGAAIMATPVGWILAAVAAIAASVFIIYDSWDNIAAWFSEKMAAVKAAFSDGVVNGLLAAWNEFNPVTVMLEAFNGLVQYLTGWDMGAILRDKFAAVVPAMSGVVQQIYQIWEGVVGWFTGKVEALRGAFSDGVGGMLNAWIELNPVTVMLEAFNGLIKYLTGWDLGAILREKIMAAVAAISSSLPEWAKDLLGIGGSVSVNATGGAPNGQPGAPGQPGSPGQPAQPVRERLPAAAIGQQAATGAAATPIGMRAAAIGQQAAQAAKAPEQRVKVEVDIKNAPQGTRAQTSGTPGTKFDTNMGFAMAAPN